MSSGFPLFLTMNRFLIAGIFLLALVSLVAGKKDLNLPADAKVSLQLSGPQSVVIETSTSKPFKFPKEYQSIQTSTKFTLSLSALSNVEVHHGLLSLWNPETKWTKSWSLKNIKKSGKYQVSVEPDADFTAAFSGANTEATLYLADNEGALLKWPLGKWKFDSLTAEESATVQQVPSWNAGEDVFQPLPEIEHIFRPDHKQPPVFISLVFTGVVLSPWALLLGLWSTLKVNTNRFNELPSGASFYSFGFFGSVAVFLGVLYLYWAHLNVFQTLSLLAPLSLVLIYFGRRTLHDSFYLHKKN